VSSVHDYRLSGGEVKDVDCATAHNGEGSVAAVGRVPACAAHGSCTVLTAGAELAVFVRRFERLQDAR
jgi:hypothetical protein